jgi:hypothetical protein
LSIQENARVQISLSVLSIQCVLGASGSAIKGVRLLHTEGEVWLASVGYDQRLSVWSVTPAASCDPDTKQEATSGGDDAFSTSIPCCQIQIYNNNNNNMNSKRKFDEQESSVVSPPPAPALAPVVTVATEKEKEVGSSTAVAPIHFTREDIQICPPSPGREQEGEEGLVDMSPSPLKWLGGSVVNIGDVNGIALLSNSDGVEMIGVVGEGIQVFNFRGKTA